MDLPIEAVERVGQGIWRIVLALRPEALLPQPGQFYSVRCGTSTSPLLRRPFSVHRIRRHSDGTLLELLVRVVGSGTAWLCSRTQGERLDVIGPLGNGFSPVEGVSAVLVARGIGIAPLYALGEVLREKLPPERLHVIMGARYSERLFLRGRLAGLGTLHLYTDDGSEGFKGRAPDLLKHLTEDGLLGERFTVYACGPDHMLRELALLADPLGFEGQAALEAHMGCGFGACLSCAVPLHRHALQRSSAWPKPALQFDDRGESVHSLICRDGPVYDLREVDWDGWNA